MADVVVIGGANIDIKAKVKTGHRLGTSNPGIVTQSVGGVGRNIAHNLAVRGIDVALISAVGEDAAGQHLVMITSSANVDCDRVASIQSEKTGTYVAILDDHGELVAAVSDMRIIEQISPSLISKYHSDIRAAKIVVADCNLSLEALLAIAEIAGERLIVETVSVEKCLKLAKVCLRHSLLLATPNLDQVYALTGTRDYNTATEKLHAMGLRNVVINLGADGAVSSDGVDVEYAEALPPTNIVDVTGAGDAALAGVIEGLLNQQTLAQAAALGQRLAGQVIASSHSVLET